MRYRDDRARTSLFPGLTATSEAAVVSMLAIPCLAGRRRSRHSMDLFWYADDLPLSRSRRGIGERSWILARSEKEEDSVNSPRSGACGTMCTDNRRVGRRVVCRGRPPLSTRRVPRFGNADLPHWPPRIEPRKGAPNVLLIITDDTGYGTPSTFGRAQT